ncbi:bifunctional purple acid phosphatase 26-like protein [Tanacetum coccineum]
MIMFILMAFDMFNDPQPDYSAFREASYGHSTQEIMNKTHAFYHWNRNDDGKKVATNAFVLHNQYWKVVQMLEGVTEIDKPPAPKQPSSSLSLQTPKGSSFASAMNVERMSSRCCTQILVKVAYFFGQWLSLVDMPKQIWALHCMIACRLRITLTASFAADSSMSWGTDLHASDLSILIGFWLALSW